MKIEDYTRPNDHIPPSYDLLFLCTGDKDLNIDAHQRKQL